MKKYISLFLIVSGLIAPISAFAYQPNDPLFEQQHYLKQIKATEAWDIQRNANDIVVAVIDTGVDFSNPELINSAWVNKKEVANNGIDDDKNGYVDDINGWNFIENNNNSGPHFYSDITRIGVSHGTAVAGVIAAEADNNIGISGLAPGAKIMSLRALSSKGDGEFDAVIKALTYAINNGAHIINLSMVSSKTNDQLENTIKEAVSKNVLVVTATGNEINSSYLNDISINLNVEPRYPICSNNSGVGVLGVGSVNDKDIKSPFSNYGQSCLDVSAPGENFVSTTPFNPLLENYRTYVNGVFTGTSVSAPLVSATAALIWQKNPLLSAIEIENIIITSGDDIDNLNPNFSGQIGRRLNVLKALQVTNESYQEKFVAGSAPGYEPYVYIFSKLGELEKKFLAYDKKFKGGFKLITGDVTGDGKAEIITIPEKGGGPHLRIFSDSGVLISQFMAGSESNTNGSNLTLIDGAQGLKNIVTINQNTKKPIINIYNWQGKLINTFLVNQENVPVKLMIAPIKVGFWQEDYIVVINSASKIVRRYNLSGKFISQWSLPFSQNEVIGFSGYNNDRLVVMKRNNNFVFDYNGALKEVTTSGFMYKFGSDKLIVDRINNQFVKNTNQGRVIFPVKDKINGMSDFRPLIK